MTREEAEKNREKWLEIAKPFADKKDKLNVRRDELFLEMEQLQEDYIKAFPVKIGDKVMDEDGRIGWISRIYPCNTPSENCMKLSLGFAMLFNIEKEDGTRDNGEVFVHGLPIKL